MAAAVDPSIVAISTGNQVLVIVEGWSYRSWDQSEWGLDVLAPSSTSTIHA